MKIATVGLRKRGGDSPTTCDDPADAAVALSAALAAVHDVTLYRRSNRSQDRPGEPSVARTRKPARVQRRGLRQLRVGPSEHVDDEALLRLMPELSGSLARRWDKDRPDVVHADGWMAGLAVLAAARDSGIPVVVSFDSLGTVDSRHRPSRPQLATRARLERAIGHGAGHVVAASPAQSLELVRMGVDRRKVTVVPHGVDLDLFCPEGPVAPRSERPRLLHVGRLEPQGGVDDIVLALRKTPGVELVVVGGPESQQLDGDPDVERIRALARSSGVDDRVQLWGRVAHREVPAVIRSADLLVTVPVDEPFGTVALESMACGTPVVASAVGGLADSVIDETSGMLVPPGDPDALAYALRRILRDPVRREGFGAAGVDRANVRYSWDRVARDVTAVYDGLTGLDRPHAADPPPAVEEHLAGVGV